MTRRSIGIMFAVYVFLMIPLQGYAATPKETVEAGVNTLLKVYDVSIEGVSMVKNYRTQFRDILAKGSAEKLLEILRKKVGN